MSAWSSALLECACSFGVWLIIWFVGGAQLNKLTGKSYIGFNVGEPTE